MQLKALPSLKKKKRPVVPAGEASQDDDTADAEQREAGEGGETAAAGASAPASSAASVELTLVGDSPSPLRSSATGLRRASSDDRAQSVSPRRNLFFSRRYAANLSFGGSEANSPRIGAVEDVRLEAPSFVASPTRFGGNARGGRSSGGGQRYPPWAALADPEDWDADVHGDPVGMGMAWDDRGDDDAAHDDAVLTRQRYDDEAEQPSGTGAVARGDARLPSRGDDFQATGVGLPPHERLSRSLSTQTGPREMSRATSVQVYGSGVHLMRSQSSIPPPGRSPRGLAGPAGQLPRAGSARAASGLPPSGSLRRQSSLRSVSFAASQRPATARDLTAHQRALERGREEALAARRREDEEREEIHAVREGSDEQGLHGETEAGGEAWGERRAVEERNEHAEDVEIENVVDDDVRDAGPPVTFGAAHGALPPRSLSIRTAMAVPSASASGSPAVGRRHPSLVRSGSGTPRTPASGGRDAPQAPGAPRAPSLRLAMLQPDSPSASRGEPDGGAQGPSNARADPRGPFETSVVSSPTSPLSRRPGTPRTPPAGGAPERGSWRAVDSRLSRGAGVAEPQGGAASGVIPENPDEEHEAIEGETWEGEPVQDERDQEDADLNASSRPPTASRPRALVGSSSGRRARKNRLRVPRLKLPTGD